MFEIYVYGSISVSVGRKLVINKEKEPRETNIKQNKLGS